MKVNFNIKNKLRSMRQSYRIIRYRYTSISTQYSMFFWDTYNFLNESQYWSIDKLQEYQWQELKQLLEHSYSNVPYYSNLFKKTGLQPSDIKNLDDLKKIPPLDKNTFALNLSDMFVQSFDKKNCRKASTSGSSGKPLQFYHSFDEVEKELAFVYHQWARVGVKPGDPMIQIRGAVSKPDNQYFCNVFNALRFSPKIENPGVARYYLKKMGDFHPEFIHGYPSAIAGFAHMIKKEGLSVPFKIKAILFSSEKVYEWERRITEEVFECKSLDFYGQAEHCCIASGCEKSSNHHFMPQYGITEIDPETNEIIATGFLNRITPFIRYRTNDVVSDPIADNCKNCGRSYPVVNSIEGRIEDYIFSPEGYPISPAIITHPFKNFQTIKTTQLIQTDLNKIILNVVLWENHSTEIAEKELIELRDGLKQIIGSSIDIMTNIIDSIPEMSSGKIKWIISEVSQQSLDKGLS